MTTTRVYKSTDAGAPTCTGQVGSLSSLLKICLVGTAGVAYGSGVTEKLAAGWSKPFEDVPTNKVALQNSLAAGGSGCVCRIYDNGVGAGGAKEAMMRTYATMSDIDTGTDPAPTVAEMTNGGPIRKSSAASSAPRAWILIANELTWTLQIVTDAATAYELSIYGGGDFESYVPGDPYNYFAMTRYAENITGGGCFVLLRTSDTLATPASKNGLWLGRGYAGTGVSIRAGFPLIGLAANATIGSTGATLAASAPGIGGRVWMPAIIAAEGIPRGRYPGMYLPLNNLTASVPGDTDSGALGLPVGSLLTILQAESQASGTSYLGAVGVESVLEW